MKRKFKVGDLVECVDGHFDYCRGPINGKKYTVISVGGNNSLWNTIGIRIPDCTYDKAIRDGTQPNWGEASFKLINNNKPKKEVDYLNAFQNNFREGI